MTQKRENLSKRTWGNVGQKVLRNVRGGGQEMPKKGHTEEQIVAALQQAENGEKVEEVHPPGFGWSVSDTVEFAPPDLGRSTEPNPIPSYGRPPGLAQPAALPLRDRKGNVEDTSVRHRE
jgi:hypothetical protein